jgi:signal transduction histidine kinase
MISKKFFRNIAIGKGRFITSRAEYKSAMLRTQMSIITIAVCVLYPFIDWVNGITNFIPFYLFGILTAVVSIYLNRRENYQFASFLLLSAANFLSYIFASNDEYRAGTYLYLIVCCLLAFALFGYRYRHIAFLFSLLSVGLFILSYVYQVKIITHTLEEQRLIYAESYVRISFITNFLIGLVLCSLIIHFLLAINHHSEREILIKNDLLSKTNQELDRFVYSASHDLKAPLSSMLGLIEIAQRTDNPAEVQTCLTMMKGRVKNLDEFILEIINYSRNSRLELNVESINLLDLTKEIVDNLKYAEGFEHIYFKYNFPVGLQINTDRARLRVILNNLISNSLKYHDNSKPEKVIEIDAEKENHFLKMTVSDNGIGIAPEHHSKIFDMFYRASEKSKGSGLGLYIVQETVRKMDGKIQMSSDVGLGTKFEIEIPA